MSIPEIETPGGAAGREPGSVSDIFSLLFANHGGEPPKNTLSGIRDFAWSLAGLEISPAELERELGFSPGHTPEPFAGMVLSALKEAPSLFEPRAGFRALSPVLFDPSRRLLSVGTHTFSPGKIIFSQIKNAEGVLFFAATAGSAVTLRCRELNDAGDQVYSYVLDALGSLVAEKATERMMEWLETRLAPVQWAITESYSPGYCNWDVAEQQKLFSFFPSRFLGITLSPSSLMSPVKSISGVIGTGPRVKRTGYHCHICTDKTCIYRRIRNPLV